MHNIEAILLHCSRDLTFNYIRAAGPGGQNVNKVATAVQLRFDVNRSGALTGEAKARLVHLAGSRMTNEGVLVIEARRYRTQEKNREDASARFRLLIERSLEKPKPRHKTRPSKASKERRLQAKKKRGEIKRARRNGSVD
jgi:ribosome-associated protein